MNPDLTEIGRLSNWLNQQGIAPQKAAGQNFLVNTNVTNTIVGTLKGGPELVTELGAGMGSLTEPLVRQGYNVKAIERDRNLVLFLKQRLEKIGKGNCQIIEHDLREADWTWPSPYQLVGNIPYNLSGWVIRQITKLEPAPEKVTLLVQQEVGERLTAGPPDMGLITLAAQLWGRAKPVQKVGAEYFWPQPKVDSMVVVLTPWPVDERLLWEQREAVLEIARGFFQNKRKQLGGGLKKKYGLTPDEAGRVLRTVHLKPTQRPQEVTAGQWVALWKKLKEEGRV